MSESWVDHLAVRLIELKSRVHGDSSRTYEQARKLAGDEFLAAEVRNWAGSGTAVGLALILDGRVSLNARHDRHVARDEFDWAAPPISDRSELWLLQQWLFLRDCDFEMVKAGKDGSLEAVSPLIVAWMDTNLDPASLAKPDTLAWHDQATALRVIRAVYFLFLLAAAGLPLQALFPRLFEFAVAHILQGTSERRLHVAECSDVDHRNR